MFADLSTGVHVHLAEDTAGFARRCCPLCARHFKVRGKAGDAPVIQSAFLALVPHANAEEVPEPPLRYCPYCGQAAAAPAFLTINQRKYLQECARSITSQLRDEQLRYVQQDSTHPTFVRVAPTKREVLPPLEPDDMVSLQVTCCREQMKIKPGWNEDLFCHYCRARHRRR
jgi:hypothetical protein